MQKRLRKEAKSGVEGNSQREQSGSQAHTEQWSEINILFKVLRQDFLMDTCS